MSGPFEPARGKSSMHENGCNEQVSALINGKIKAYKTPIFDHSWRAYISLRRPKKTMAPVPTAPVTGVECSQAHLFKF